MFNVDLKRRNSPSTRCASAANTIDSDTNNFNGLVSDTTLIDNSEFLSRSYATEFRCKLRLALS